MKPAVLVVDDDEPMRDMVVELLQARRFDAEPAASAKQALERADSREFDCILTDLQMPGMDGLALLGLLREAHPDTPVVLMTSFGTIKDAVTAMRVGAHDFVTKPFEADHLALTIERAVESRVLLRENRSLRRGLARTASFGDLVGKSGPMNEIYALIRKIGHNGSNVLITGESGTGKEVVARTIHYTGARSAAAFVPLNCTAMPEGLLESELFGHARGAFTGAHATKKGLFEEAHGGTLFLDEIGDMSPTLQGKLLRVLQDREVRPVGANQSVKVDVRLIAATHRDLHAEIEAGAFREDLYYRLNVIPVHVPPLRERTDDIPALARAFVERHSPGRPRVLTEDAIRKLQRASWPGNARELENCIERSLALGSGDEIGAADILLAEDTRRAAEGIDEMLLELARSDGMTLHELGERYVDAVLAATDGQKTEAARILGIHRRTLYRREERPDGVDTDG